MAYRGGGGGGQGGGMAPGRKPWRGRLPSLEGAPAQLVGPNCKKKIRPRQISKVTSLQCRINLVAKVAYICYGPRALKGPALPMP